MSYQSANKKAHSYTYGDKTRFWRNQIKANIKHDNSSISEQPPWKIDDLKHRQSIFF